MGVLENILYFILTLGVLVFVHEFGHFIAAKIFGMRVDRFSIGFPPRAFGKQIGETDYCVSWIPIGGYVKIAGMIDESFDTEYLEKPPEPWEFRSKPIWQRMVVISAGVLMNILLAAGIFAGINYVQGRTVRETTEIGYVVDGSAAAQGQLHTGDKVIAINGKAVANWDDIITDIYVESMGNDVVFSLDRGGARVEATVPRASIPEPNKASFGILPAHSEIVIGTVEPGKPADKIGLKPGDIILAMNGTPIGLDMKVREIVQANAGKPLLIEWRRNGEVLSGTAVPTAEGKIGISFGTQYNGPRTKIQYSLLEAIPTGFRDIVSVSVLFVQQLWQVVVGKTALAETVGGPIKIAQMATQSAEIGIIAYLGFMALLSVSLAVINIFPFPALDGGHLAFLVYEGIFRREVPVKVKMGLQKVGFVLLIAFMIFVVYNDIIHF